MSNISINTKASFLIFAGTFAQRLLGLASTLVLARLLSPSDFGLVAVTWLVLRLINGMAVTGVQEYIVQKSVATNEDLNTAWTINCALKIVVIIGILLISPYAASYYDEPSLNLALPVLAIVLVQVALVNPYLFLLRRERKYEKLFKIDIYAKAFSAFVTITMAYVLQNYWALIIGHLASSSVKLFLSYAMFSYRPTFSIKGISEQLKFSQWMFFRGIFVYLRVNLDNFLVSHKFGIELFGGYHVSKYLAMMPAVDGILPATEPLFASFSSVQDDKDKLRYQISFALLAILTLTFPLTAFVFINTKEISTVLLGEKWVQYIPVFSVLSIAITTIPLYNYCVSILLVKKLADRIFFYDVVTFAGLALILIAAPIKGLVDFAWYKTIFELISTSALLAYSLIIVSIHNVKRIFTLAILSAVCAYTLAGQISEYVGGNFGDFVTLFIEGVLFLLAWATYCQVVFQVFFRNTTIGHHVKHLELQYLRGFRFFSIIR